MTKHKQTIIKIVVSITILGLIVISIDFKTSIKTFLNINHYILFSSIFLYSLGQILCAKKWEILSKLYGLETSFFNYIKYYFKGMFFNTFLPTNIGGDLMKIRYIYLEQKEKSLEQAFVSVLSDRLTGLCVLILVGTAGIFIPYANIYVKILMISIFAVLSISILFILYCITRKSSIKNKFLLKICQYGKLLINKKFFQVLLLSLIFHIFMIIIHILIGKSMDLNIPPSYYMLLYPLAAIAASLPISINGIGIKEAVYIFLMAQVSIEPSVSIVFVLCLNLIILICSFLGTIFFINYKQKNK